MKKKIFSILMILFLSITCGVLSACKDRYKDMKFNIQYAYSEDATDWYNGNNGISIFHSNKTEQQGLVFDNGVARIYFKVNISNVNAKYIDDIVITTAGTSFVIDPITVKQGKVFSIEIYEDTKIQTSLEMYETNSNKKGTVTFNVSRALSGITADIQRTPAVMVGSSIIHIYLSILWRRGLIIPLSH